MALNGYNQTYDAGETSEVAVDFIIKLGVVAISFATLIGLVALFVWAKKRLKF